MTALGAVDALHDVAAALGPSTLSGDLDEARQSRRVGPPVRRPRNVFGVGLNYADHAAETNTVPPEHPLVFTKFPSCIGGPDDDIVLACDTADWEVELVVVVGAGGRDIDPQHVWSHVAGLTVGQDISDRVLQYSSSPPHFDLGKSRDTYGPIGPMLVSPDAFGAPDDLAIGCAINGEQRQSGRTSSMIFDVVFLVSYLSRILTLRPGDLIFTGTPDGVGVASGTFLAPGDVITSTIEGIGTLINQCR
jgi:2-keto-4-pentenoate hydratase/2-oxohepta-3-ene-1,7-dioic acid hydratase in catechol pathway